MNARNSTTLSAAITVATELQNLLPVDELPEMAGFDVDTSYNTGAAEVSCQLSSGTNATLAEILAGLTSWIDVLPGVARLHARSLVGGTWQLMAVGEVAGIKFHVWDHVQNVPENTDAAMRAAASPADAGDVLLTAVETAENRVCPGCSRPITAGQGWAYVAGSPDPGPMWHVPCAWQHDHAATATDQAGDV